MIIGDDGESEGDGRCLAQNQHTSMVLKNRKRTHTHTFTPRAVNKTAIHRKGLPRECKMPACLANQIQCNNDSGD
jgi:hypothetical protein